LTHGVKVVPLADESLGVRSMSVLVEAGSTVLLFDAGVSLAPSRYGLPPHPSELMSLVEARRRILGAAARADAVFISHFHKDHYTPHSVGLYEASGPEVFAQTYRGKVVYVIDPATGVTRNQARRARSFLSALEGLASAYMLGDGAVIEIGPLRIEARLYSHGSGRLGRVLGVYLVAEGEVMAAYLPDVQGPVDPGEAEEIVRRSPGVLIIGGPPTYLAYSHRVSGGELERGLRNLAYIISTLSPQGTRVYVSHHLLRDSSWEEVLEGYGVDRSDFCLYSDYYNREPELLEAYRRELYSYDPPPENYLAILRRGVRRSPEEILAALEGFSG